MKKYPAFILIFIIASLANAQFNGADTTKIKLELKDGSVLFGSITEEDSVTMRFLTGGGIPMSIPHRSIRYKSPFYTAASVPDTVRRQFTDPNRTRLFLMPTARPIGSGRGYFSAAELFFPSIAFGLGNFITLAGGMSIFPGLDEQLIYLAPKVTLFNSPNVSLAVGSLYLGSGVSEGNTAMLYAAGTFGSERSSVTVAARIPTEADQNSMFVIGGELQTSGSVKLITENWIFDEGVLYGFGLRFFGEKLAADLGFFRSSGQNSSDGFPFFPWLGFTYNFGGPVDLPTVPQELHDRRPVSIRGALTYNFFTFSNDEEIQRSLRDQGFYTDHYYGGSFYDGGSRTGKGNGILLQLEHRVSVDLFAGITYSTLGDPVGSSPAFTASKYSSGPVNFVNILMTVSRSVSTYAAHIAYSSVNAAEDHEQQSITVGGGLGVSRITMLWEQSYGYALTGSRSRSQSRSEFTTLLYASFEQHLAQSVSVVIDASYFLMPESIIERFHLATNVSTDYTANPPVPRTTEVYIDRFRADFSYGKIGIGIRVGL